MIKLAWSYSLQVSLPVYRVKYRTRGSNQQVAKLPTLVALSIITRPSLISAFSRSRLHTLLCNYPRHATAVYWALCFLDPIIIMANQYHLCTKYSVQRVLGTLFYTRWCANNSIREFKPTYAWHQPTRHYPSWHTLSHYSLFSPWLWLPTAAAVVHSTRY